MIRMNWTNLSVKRRKITVRNSPINCQRLREGCRTQSEMAARKM
jgi:hypothetical protein